MSFNPYNDPVARELHNANAELRSIGDQLDELNQPPEVRAARQADRAAQSQVTVSGVGLVLGLAAAWVLISLVFGRIGQRVFGSVLGFAWEVLNFVFVIAAIVGVVVLGFRMVRSILGLGRQGTDGSR